MTDPTTTPLGAEDPGGIAGVDTAVQESPAAGLGPSEPVGQDQLDTARGAIAEWTVTILLLLFGTTTLVQAFVIPTGSMEDTLLIGDHLLVDKLAYAPPGPFSKYVLPYTPVKRGDIIVFRYPADIKQTYVKRVVGIPGDHIRIDSKTVYLNGTPVKEAYKYHKSEYLQTYRDFFPGEPNVGLSEGGLAMLERHVVKGEVIVPDNCYFAMGDNRDSSFDSRYWGFVPRENIIGKPFVIYWSYDAPTDRLAGSAVSWDHISDLGRNFFTKTRWGRTLRLVRGTPVE